MNYDRLNHALANHIKLPWLTSEDREAIYFEYGADILIEIDKLLAFAAKDTLWITLNYSAAYNKTLKKLMDNYPFLDEESVRKIASIASYSWK